MPDINKTRFDFRPYAEENEIVYGLKAINGVGTGLANAIVKHQPYTSMMDFYNKLTSAKKEEEGIVMGEVAMIQLIKAGCFDALENKPRMEIMKDFLKSIVPQVTELKVSHIELLNKLNLLSTSQKENELRWYKFKNYVFKKQNISEKVGKSDSTYFYLLEDKFAAPYFMQIFAPSLKEEKDYKFNENGELVVKKGAFDKLYNQKMESFLTMINSQAEFKNAINNYYVEEKMKEKCSGTISAWEMQSINYYYHEHELAHINNNIYNTVSFDDLPEEPEITDVYYYKGQSKPRYKLSRICGTVVDRDKSHGVVTLLTPTGVVPVKLYKGAFSFYDKTLTEIDEQGEKHRTEESWFKRGTKLLVTGFRSETNFIAKKYKDSIYRHSIALIESIDEKGNLELITERKGEDNENELPIAI